MTVLAGKLRPIAPFAIGDVIEDRVRRAPPPPREMMSLRRWHVVQVVPQRERAVAEEIEKLGLAAYVPLELCKVAVRERLRYREMLRPMIPGYVFAGFDPACTTWLSILPHPHEPSGIDGVLRLFMIEARPVPIAEPIMDYIRSTEAEGRDHGRCRKRAPIGVKVGEVVRVLSGPFAAFFGLVTDIDRKERRVIVEMDIFGRKVPVELLPDQVESV